MNDSHDDKMTLIANSDVVVDLFCEIRLTFEADTLLMALDSRIVLFCLDFGHHTT